MWNAWGIAWGDSWGWSWGPLHEVYEPLQQVYGSGKKSPGPKPDSLQDGPPIVRQESDDDLIRRVNDKWDAIEAAQARDRSHPPEKSHVSAEAALASPEDSKTIASAAEIAVLVPPIADAGIAALEAQQQRNAKAIAAILLMAEA